MEECRICLEDDILENLISPCYCRGTNKYVHASCLNQWRALSDNSENIEKCPTCKFNYVFENSTIVAKTRKNIIFNYFTKFIGNNIILLLIVNGLLLLFFTYIIYYINNSNYYILGHYEKDMNFDSLSVVQLSIILISAFYFLLFLNSYRKSENKKLLLKYFKRNYIFFQVFFYLFSIIFLFITPMISLLINCIIINTLFKTYLEYLNAINSTKDQEVISLSDDEISEYLLSKNTQTNIEITNF